MAFNKKIWKDRIVEFPGRRDLKNIAANETTTFDVSRNEGLESQAGDAFSAANMNDLEQRIDESFTQLYSDMNVRYDASTDYLQVLLNGAWKNAIFVGVTKTYVIKDGILNANTFLGSVGYVQTYPAVSLSFAQIAGYTNTDVWQRENYYDLKILHIGKGSSGDLVDMANTFYFIKSFDAGKYNKITIEFECSYGGHLGEIIFGVADSPTTNNYNMKAYKTASSTNGLVGTTTMTRTLELDISHVSGNLFFVIYLHCRGNTRYDISILCKIKNLTIA